MYLLNEKKRNSFCLATKSAPNPGFLVIIIEWGESGKAILQVSILWRFEQGWFSPPPEKNWPVRLWFCAPAKFRAYTPSGEIQTSAIDIYAFSLRITIGSDREGLGLDRRSESNNVLSLISHIHSKISTEMPQAHGDKSPHTHPMPIVMTIQIEISIPKAAPVACSITVSVSSVAEAGLISDDLLHADVIPVHKNAQFSA